MKWFLFALAIITTFLSCIVERSTVGTMSSNSVGGAAAGLWVAFALIHVQHMKMQPSRQDT